jgi:hypothetical protein
MTRFARRKVLEKISKYWPDEDANEILRILDRYGEEANERARTRVQLAIIKLSEGKRKALDRWVERAKRDYRDVVAYAEYPEEMRTGYAMLKELSKEEVKALRRRDRKQYLMWLGG